MVMKQVMVAGLPSGAQHRQKVHWSGRETRRRMSRYCPGTAVAVIAQSLWRGHLVPVPHERRPNRALASASSVRIVLPDGRVTW